MKKTLIYLLTAIFCISAQAKDVVSGTILDENNEPLPYATIRIKNKKLTILTDSLGKFNLTSDQVAETDTFFVSYLGYKSKKISIADMENSSKESIKLNPQATLLQEVTVLPGKTTKRIKGKKHTGGFMKGFLEENTKGLSYGFEFHTKKSKKLWLHKVGFYFCEGRDQMTHMKFRINIYDMSKVTKSPSRDFKAAYKPLYFEYNRGPSSPTDGKFEHMLPEYVELPVDALVEIEFLEDLGDEKFWYKCNLIGRGAWTRNVFEGVYWEKMPFASPFFMECIETKRD